MSLEEWSYLATIVGSIGVIVSLLFVGVQIRANTAALQRTEHNSTMEQWTVVRMGIVRNREVAELMTGGLEGTRRLDAADRLRLEQMMQEFTWAAFHIWDRTQRGIFPPGTFEATGGAFLSTALRTPAGSAWWQAAKQVGFVPGFVTDVDALLRKDKQRPSGMLVAGSSEVKPKRRQTVT